ncbi:SH3 domain-containing protein [Acaryochloris sp. 'Moss Beach']|uniref:SH3 domain-containing protein n=1 Tax=Acaryochloris sp. 'Moss Beach' TaxID=2740837 RepID=UPI001F36A22B|nr:SH3 domain-containing protein [Acaryochloris sp. 'Moss Beach']UJB68318.1 SH3 domain-containing protein [Acaryochloris sp. 'Moss Beach']
MKPSQIAQIIIGVILGLAIVGGAVGGAGYLYLNRFSQIPQKPKFPNDAKPAVPAKPKPYPAVVIYPDGLFLRKERSSDADVIKVLEYEEPVTVIEASPDQKWQKIKADLEGEDVEGWVSMGNTERVQEDVAAETPPEAEPEPAF